MPRRYLVEYIPRITDQEMAGRLKTAGFVVVEGPRAVGKTETAKRFARSTVHLDTDKSARALVAMGSNLVLEGETPRLIDEWESESGVWELVKQEIDKRKKKGQFILTGSAMPSDSITRTTVAGRIARIKMRPLSLYEIGKSSGEVSVAELFAGATPRAIDSGMTIAGIVDLICTGGWPMYVSESVDVARQGMQDYLEEISRMDVQQISGMSHDPIRVKAVLRSLARNVGTKTSISTITADAAGSNGNLDWEVVDKYLMALSRLMITEDLPSWAPHIRSKARLRSSDTRFFVDPCLAVAALQVSQTTLLHDMEAVGLLFENLVLRDLRIYTQGTGAHLSQYRDSNGLEADVIIEAFEGKWAAFEVKLGVNRIDEGATSLLRLAKEVDTSKMGKPSFLAVVTSTGYAYKRPDGVFVIPIGSLKP